MVGSESATCWLYFQDTHMVDRQDGYPLAYICRMSTWWLASWLPFCHYLQDDHMVGPQVGYLLQLF
jgi:hypothetical protein